MNRVLPILNLLGVLALAVLCAVQWRANRRVNLEAADLTKVRIEQAAKLEEQAKTIAGLSTDLDSFRTRLKDASELAKETDAKVRPLERQVQQLGNERDQLKASVTTWSEAVTARDDRLKEMNRQLQELAGSRNDTVTKFNDLADKYNGVVKDLNEARARLAAAQTNAPAPAKPQ